MYIFFQVRHQASDRFVVIEESAGHYPDDRINRDGGQHAQNPPDVPRNEQLPMVYGTSGIYDIVYWSDYDSQGQSRAVEATYINSADSWFFVFPEEWLGNVTVHRQDSVGGERAVIFSFLDRRNEAVDFLKIYTLTGDNREERAAAAGRFVIRREDEKVFVAEITARPEGLQVEREQVEQSFNILYSEWMTGEVG